VKAKPEGRATRTCEFETSPSPDTKKSLTRRSPDGAYALYRGKINDRTRRIRKTTMYGTYLASASASVDSSCEWEIARGALFDVGSNLCPALYVKVLNYVSHHSFAISD
jgi:hypothetical protein